MVPVGHKNRYFATEGSHIQVKGKGATQKYHPKYYICN
jgi:hypothetical protein